MKNPIYFIAPTYAQGAYWARQWGWDLREVTIITHSFPQHTHGRRGGTAFVVGNRPMPYELELALAPCGFTLIDGQDLR